MEFRQMGLIPQMVSYLGQDKIFFDKKGMNYGEQKYSIEL